MGLFDGVGRVLFLHAHPDDETLATGALIAALAREGTSVAVVTATRGERGDVVEGPLRHLQGTSELVARRERELAGAIAALGVGTHAFLGEPPARAADLPPRRYLDSGMRWVTESLAGPAPDAGADALTAAPIVEAAADLAAFCARFGPDLLVSYDIAGGYGHPDHVACHHIAVAAADLAGVPLAEVVSEPLLGRVGAAAEVVDLPERLADVQRALRCHASQLTVDGAEVVHSGGQRQPILTRFVLTPHAWTPGGPTSPAEG